MKKRILIIDDEPDFVAVLKLRLEANNYDVSYAYDGCQGLEKARAQKPDLILLDIGMPKMDGYTFIKTVKNDPSLQNTPIIVLTGRGEKMKDLFELEGIKDYILKPFETQDLLNRINKCF